MIVGIISILEFHLNILIETTMTIVVVLCFEISLQRQLVLSSFVLEYKAHAVDMLWTLAKHVPTFKLLLPFFRICIHDWNAADRNMHWTGIRPSLLRHCFLYLQPKHPKTNLQPLIRGLFMTSFFQKLLFVKYLNMVVRIAVEVSADILIL